MELFSREEGASETRRCVTTTTTGSTTIARVVCVMLPPRRVLTWGVRTYSRRYVRTTIYYTLLFSSISAGVQKIAEGKTSYELSWKVKEMIKKITNPPPGYQLTKWHLVYYSRTVIRAVLIGDIFHQIFSFCNFLYQGAEAFRHNLVNICKLRV